MSETPAPTFDFRMLGPLAVERNDVPVALAAEKPRALLAFLLLRRNHVTPMDSILEALWEDAPPPTALAAAQVYVSQLRRALAEPPGHPVTIVTAPPGYVLRVDEQACDIGRFETLRRQARACADARQTARLLRLALEEWSGPALADLQQYRFAAEVAAALAEDRLTTLEDRIAADLACGEHRALVGELTELTSTNPYRETLWEQLVLALYRSGRQSEALAAYQRMRALLQDDLGIDPSPRLRDLEAAVLRQDPALERPADLPPSSLAAVATPAAPEPPTISDPHVVGLLLTDVEGSTQLWHRYADQMPQVMVAHNDVVSAVVSAHEGRLPPDQGEGDSRLAVFPSIVHAVVAAGELQDALQGHEWPEGVRPAVRMAVHAGSVVEVAGNVFGSAVHRCARLRALANGRQVLVSGTAASLTGEALPAAWELTRLGRFALRDFEDEEEVFQLDRRGKALEFPPLRSSVRLPVDTTPFVGRRDEVEVLAGDVARHRLVTLTGLGGSGKTRLAVECARVSVATFPVGVTFVDLSSATSETDFRQTVRDAVENASPHSLVVLDNLEQIPRAGALVADLLARTPAHVLATTRLPLGVPGEVVRPVAAMPRADAVALFRERAMAAEPDVEIDRDVAGELVDLLGCVPLALELAAARLRVVDLVTLHDTLTRELSLLTDSGTARPERQRSVTALLVGSWDELSEAQRRVLGALATFRTWTTAQPLATTTGLPGGDVIDALDHLVSRGLVSRTRADGVPTFGVLELVRGFVEQHLDPSHAEQLRAEHARLFLTRARDASGAARAELRAALRFVATQSADPGLSTAQRLDLGRLALHLGWYEDAVALLEPVAAEAGAANPLGQALVRRAGPGDLARGRDLLAAAADGGDADAAASLGGTYKDSDPVQSRQWYERALSISPEDPYPLGNLVELEVQETGSLASVAAHRARLEAGLRRRRGEAAGQEDLPWSWFDAGKFALLLGEDEADALHCLLRGVTTASHPQQLQTTLASIRRLTVPGADPAWGLAAQLLSLAHAARVDSGEGLAAPAVTLAAPVVVLAGASARADHKPVMAWLEPLVAAMPGGGGTIVSGGTSQGVSALAAAAGRELPGWRSVGYLPARLPRGVTSDDRYDQLRRTQAAGFGLSEPLAYWSDLLASRVRPADVYLLGIGGSVLTGLELHLAAALGAVVAVGGVESAALDAISPIPTDIHAQLVHPEARSLRTWLSTTAPSWNERGVLPIGR
ncbi:MAG TPA: BTAD domain-containing putative transcriptional regulator [Actinomycetes bacterium]|nr:BTAD domain-containing putative transcriptional regulator [Actinomycetes bacterium]